jgi:hypothetical protein
MSNVSENTENFSIWCSKFQTLIFQILMSPNHQLDYANDAWLFICSSVCCKTFWYRKFCVIYESREYFYLTAMHPCRPSTFYAHPVCYHLLFTMECIRFAIWHPIAEFEHALLRVILKLSCWDKHQGGHTFTSICVYHTTVWHFESKECLGKICVPCPGVYHLQSCLLLFSILSQNPSYSFNNSDNGWLWIHVQEFVIGGISENSWILMDHFSHDKMDWTVIVES